MSEEESLDNETLAKLGIDLTSLVDTEEKWEKKATEETIDTQSNILSLLGLSDSEGNDATEEAWEKKATIERTTSISETNNILAQLGVDASELDNAEKWEQKGKIDI